MVSRRSIFPAALGRVARPLRNRRRRRSGLVLFVVLIIVALLSVLTASYTYLVQAETQSVEATVDDFQARAAAESGIQLAIYALRESQGDFRQWYDQPELFRGATVWSSDGSDGQDSVATGLADQGGLTGEDPAEDAADHGKTLDPRWRINLVARNDDDPTRLRYGITDETSKVDINLVTPQQLRRMINFHLSQIGSTDLAENIDVDVLIDSLFDWREAGEAARPSGAKDDYYLANHQPPHRAKNAPFETVDELLLVRGYTARILYGEDFNRNGLLDQNEDDGTGSFPPDNADGVLNPGLAAYFTVWSRETNLDSTLKPRVNINLQDLALLEEQLNKIEGLSPDIINYILQVRRSGQSFRDLLELVPVPEELIEEDVSGLFDDLDKDAPNEQMPDEGDPSDPKFQDDGNSGLDNPDNSAKEEEQKEEEQDPAKADGKSRRSEQGRRNDAGQQQRGNGGRGTPPDDADNGGGSGDDSGDQPQGNGNQNDGTGRRPQRPGAQSGQGGGRNPSSSQPGNGQNRQPQRVLPPPVGTVDDLPVILDKLSTNPLPSFAGRINVNTASRTVLMALTELSEDQINQIVATRTTLDAANSATPAWLATQGIISLARLRVLLPKITTSSSTFTIESVGYADHLDAVKRLYVVLEMRGPIGQVLYYKDLTGLGPAYNPREEEVRGITDSAKQ